MHFLRVCTCILYVIERLICARVMVMAVLKMFNEVGGDDMLGDDIEDDEDCAEVLQVFPRDDVLFFRILRSH